MSLGSVEEARVDLEVVLGRTSKSIAKLAEIGTGTIIELDAIAGEPVELRAGGAPIARGEVVIMDENFGIRVTAMVDDARG